jgi:CO/xanthine dehydrogenase Mo-binding subunit
MCAAKNAGVTRLVGRSMPTLEALDKATGRVEYMGDITVPNMAHAKIVRSPFAHAMITSIDASAARALPGVVCVFTRDELAADPDIQPIYGFVYRDAPVVAIDKVRHEGDIVAIVVAETEAIAEEAVELVDVDYEELPSVMDVDAALADGAIQVHKEFFPIAPELNPIAGTNICHQAQIAKGDIVAGFAEADFIYEDTYSAPPVQHAALDRHAMIAHVEDESITVWTNCQSPFPLQREIQRIFGMPARVIVPYVGGGFGSKSRDRIEVVITAAAKLAKRPVRYVMTQEETFQTFIRPAYSSWIKTGVKKDGTIVARHHIFTVDVGAYAISGARSANNTLKVATGPYRIPNAVVDCYAVYTNKPPSAPYRGLPTTQHTMSYETQFDRIAKDMGIDRLEMRRRNLVRDGDIHLTGDWLRSAHTHECLDQVTEAIGWDKPLAPSADGKIVRGRGVASTIKYTLTPPREMSENSAEIALGEDGIFEARFGTVNMGQGSDTTMMQITGDALGVGFDLMRLVHSDTGRTPVDSSTTASRSTYHMGNALVDAAGKLTQQIRETASQMLERDATKLVISDEGITIDGEPDHGLSFEEFVRRAGGPVAATGECVVGGTWKAPDGNEYPIASTFWTFASCAAEVEVDTETGQVRLVKAAASATTGTAINPHSIETQLEGGVGQELGPTLFEQMVWSDDGQLMNPTLMDYPLPTMQTMPEYYPRYVEHPFEGGPFGAKGMGEIGAVIVPGAVLNAVHDATGVMFHDVPLLPYKVLEAIDASAGAES